MVRTRESSSEYPVHVQKLEVLTSLHMRVRIFTTSAKLPRRTLKVCLAAVTASLRVSFGLALTGFFIIARWLLYVESSPSAWMHFFGCGIVGMVTAYIFILSTQVRERVCACPRGSIS